MGVVSTPGEMDPPDSTSGMMESSFVIAFESYDVQDCIRSSIILSLPDLRIPIKYTATSLRTPAIS